MDIVGSSLGYCKVLFKFTKLIDPLPLKAILVIPVQVHLVNRSLWIESNSDLASGNGNLVKVSGCLHPVDI